MSFQPERVRERRRALELSQAELAKKAGIDQRQVSLTEVGKNSPTIETLAKLAKALETSADYLLGLTDFAARPDMNMDLLDELEREVVMLLRSKDPERRAAIIEMVRLAK